MAGPPLRVLAFAFVAIALPGAWPRDAAAQAFPSRPVRIVVPQTPGTPADNIARALAEQLSEYWQQSVVIEARPGAGGTIAAEFVARSPADGYTLLIANSSNMTIAPALDQGLRYDPVADFAPIARVIDVPFIVVSNSALPVKTMPELVAYARAHPGRVTYLSFGEATVTHMAFESLKAAAAIDIVEVGYKTYAQAMPDLITGRVDLCLCDIVPMRPHIDAGKVRVLGVIGENRLASMPEVPTVSQQGVPGFSLGMWYGVVAPSGIPPAVRATLVEAVNRARRTPEVIRRIEFLGFQPVLDDPTQFAAVIRSEIDKYTEIAKKAQMAARGKSGAATGLTSER
jgi:tripartite-type tricarboxylate transporter receptor subunit TctC